MDTGWLKFLPTVQRNRRRSNQRVYKHYVVEEQTPVLSVLKRTSVRFAKGLYIAKGYHNQTPIDNQVSTTDDV